MRVVLYDVNGDQYTIRSENMETIKAWLFEYFPLMIQSTEQYHYPWRIEVWPEYKAPAVEPVRYAQVTPEGLRDLASWALNAAIVLAGNKS